MRFKPPIPLELWDQIPPAAQAALIVVFQQDEQRIAALEQRVRDLEERLGQNSTNSSRPPSTDAPAVKRPPPRPRGQRPRGGQPGHPRQVRPWLPPDQVHQLRPAACRRCGHRLRGDDPSPLRHQVLELPPLRPVVTEYRRHRLRCPACQAVSCAPLPGDVAASSCGPRLQAVAALLTGACRLSKRTASWLCRHVLGAPLSPAELCRLERQTTRALEPAVAEARAHVGGQPANVDETSWRQGKRRGWLWTAVTACVTVFLIRLSRGAGVLRELLGAGHRQVVTSDRFPAYDGLPLERRQVCWAHLRRDFQAMIDRGGPAAPIGYDLLGLSDDLFFFWPRVRDGTWPVQRFRAQVADWRQQLRGLLARGAGCGCAKTEAVCQGLQRLEPALWTFAHVAGVEPTNNAAERALRHAVQWRKTSYGTDGEAGSRFAESILTVVASCRQQGRDVLEYLTACCQALRHRTAPPSLLPQTNG
jgi:transposase